MYAYQFYVFQGSLLLISFTNYNNLQQKHYFSSGSTLESNIAVVFLSENKNVKVGNVIKYTVELLNASLN